MEKPKKISYLVKSSSGIYYYSFSINGVKHRKSLRTKDKAMAKRLQKIMDARQEEARAGLTPKKTPILEEALARHIDAKAVTARASTFLLDAGLCLRDVMQILGWTRLETVQKYIHYNDAKNIDISKLPY